LKSFGKLGKGLLGKLTPALREGDDDFLSILADGIDIGLEIAEEIIEKEGNGLA
jgi:hypothetical protein